VISLVLALYMTKIKLPVPLYTRKKKFHTIRYPYHQVFAVSTTSNYTMHIDKAEHVTHDDATTLILMHVITQLDFEVRST